MVKKPNFKIDEILLVFIVAVIIIVIGMYEKASQPVSPLEAEKIAEDILNGNVVGLIEGGEINALKLQEIQDIDYDDLKELLNAKNDFCIYIEDENGNIILSKGATMFNDDEIYCQE